MRSLFRETFTLAHVFSLSFSLPTALSLSPMIVFNSSSPCWTRTRTRPIPLPTRPTGMQLMLTSWATSHLAVRANTHTHKYTDTPTHTLTPTHMHTSAYTHTHTHIHSRTHTHAQSRKHFRVSACMYLLLPRHLLLPHPYCSLTFFSLSLIGFIWVSC